MSQKNFSSLLRTSVADQPLLLCLVLALCCVAWAQPDKNEPGKASLTGRYEGTAKNKAEEVIAVTLDLTEKDGALSGMINSSHGDFPITGGTHKGEAVTIEFDAGGPGTISLRLTEDRLVGTWTAGEDGGSVDVKRVVKQGEAPKGKSSTPGVSSTLESEILTNGCRQRGTGTATASLASKKSSTRVKISGALFDS